MTTLIGCIADDFTGATDLAGLLARSGVRVSLRIGVPSEAPADAAPIEVIALKCRTAPVADAVAATREALAWLRRAGARQVFWKYCSTFDSTPAGNIGPVAEALMADLGVAQTIYCPAFPENGRTVFMGNLFVGEQPLAESPMKDHPLTPMRDSSLVRLLAPQVTQPVGLVSRPVVARGMEAVRARLAELAVAGVAHVVVDAITDDDLRAIAGACRDWPLLTGGSAVAMPLPELWLSDGALSRAAGAGPMPEVGDAAIVLSGSCSSMTNRQVAAFLGRGPALRLDPLDLAAAGADAAVDWVTAQAGDATPIVYATAEPEAVRAAQRALGPERAGALVEEALAACAAAALAQGRRRFVVAGGETSGAVTRALGIARLDIGAEITPGVPWCFATSGGATVAVALKSGNFGGEEFFGEALASLDAGRRSDGEERSLPNPDLPPRL